MFVSFRYQRYLKSVFHSDSWLLPGLCVAGLIACSGANAQALLPPPAGNPPARMPAPPPAPRPMGGASIAANGDSLYVLQGTSFYRLRAPNFSVIAQQRVDLPPFWKSIG